MKETKAKCCRGEQNHAADERHVPERQVNRHTGSGVPMKEALDAEMARHKESRVHRINHLEDHCKR